MAFQLPHDFKSFRSFELKLTKVARSNSSLQIVLDINGIPCSLTSVSVLTCSFRPCLIVFDCLSALAGRPLGSELVLTLEEQTAVNSFNAITLTHTNLLLTLLPCCTPKSSRLPS